MNYLDEPFFRIVLTEYYKLHKSKASSEHRVRPLLRLFDSKRQEVAVMLLSKGLYNFDVSDVIVEKLINSEMSPESVSHKLIAKAVRKEIHTKTIEELSRKYKIPKYKVVQYTKRELSKIFTKQVINGKGVEEIAKEHGISKHMVTRLIDKKKLIQDGSTLSDICRRTGVSYNTLSNYHKKRKYTRITESEGYMIQQMRLLGHSLSEIAKVLSRRPNTIYYYVKRLEVTE